MPPEEIMPEETPMGWVQLTPDGNAALFCICVRYVEGVRHDYASAIFNPTPAATIQIDDCDILIVERTGKMSRRRTIQMAARALAKQLGVRIASRPDHTDGEWYFYLVR